jgi:hypothetical protein
MNPRKDNTKRIQTEARLFPFWVEDRGLSFFLGFLVLVTIFIPMFRLSRYGRISLRLMFALCFSPGRSPLFAGESLVIALTVVQLSADLIVEFYPSLGRWGWDTALKVFRLAILVIMTLKHTLRPGPVSLYRVMGEIVGYLLIGLTWAFGYKLLMEERPDAVHFQAFIGGIPTGEPSRLISFSFSTLRSVSYGHAYPVRRVARSMVSTKALIGQLYPSVLVASLVGRSLQRQPGAG